MQTSGKAGRLGGEADESMPVKAMPERRRSDVVCKSNKSIQSSNGLLTKQAFLYL